MQIDQIIRPDMSRREARAALKKAGWTFVGGGSFATVYASPDGTVVAKVTKPDAGASALFRLARANPDNPHFPRYAGRIRLGARGYVYEVERLDLHANYWIATDEVAVLDTYQAALDLITAEIDASQASQRRKDLFDDYGPANAMQRRDGTYVLTDPIYAEEDLSRVYRGRSGSNPDYIGYDEDPDDTDVRLTA